MISRTGRIERNALRSAATALGAAVVVAMAACGGDDSGDATAGAGTNSKDVTIAFVTANTTDPFYTTMEKGAREEAKRLGVELDWQGPTEFSPEKQLPIVDSVLAKQPDAFVLTPTDESALRPAVDRALGMDIPVLTADTGLADTSGLTSVITGDNVQGGALAGQVLAKALDGEGQTYLMNGVPAIANDRLRKQGFLEELKAHPGMENVGEQFSGSDANKATTIIQTVLQRSPDLDGVFCVDTPTCVGTVRGLDNAGKLPALALVAYDAAPDVVDAVGNGKALAAIAQQPAKEAALAVRYAVAAVKGQTGSIDKEVKVKSVAITRDNFDATKRFAYVTSP